MSHRQPSGAEQEPGRVEIRVRGHLGPHWSARLNGLALTTQDDGTTLIHGTVVDQAALFGVLQQLRDMAVPLLSLVHADPAARPTEPTPTTEIRSES